MLTIDRIWKRDKTVNVMSLDAAAANLGEYAADAEVRALGPDAIAEGLLMGRTYQTPRAIFRRGWPQPAPQEEVKMLLGLGKRRQLFRQLVAAQDEGASVPEAYARIEQAHGLTGPLLRAIEEEGLAQDWPMEKDYERERSNGEVAHAG